MESSISDRGILWSKLLDTGQEATISFVDIRRERTGVHAAVGMLLNGRILEHDTFNITRSEERRRLAKAAFSSMNDVEKLAWPMEAITYDLGQSCLLTPRVWEEERIKIVQYNSTDDPGPVEFVIRPWIIRGGGTIYFAAPGSGKSYLLQSQALCIAANQNGVWDVQSQHPVLYINLERDPRSLHRRENALKSVHNLPAVVNVSYLHGRGLPLTSVARSVKAWIAKQHHPPVIFLDSISRSGIGPLNEDSTANHIIDLLNSWTDGADAWVAIGHTPANNQDKLFGSMHFQAGCDIEVKIQAALEEKTVGVAMSIQKSNDIGRYSPAYLALEFSDPDRPITNIREARPEEFRQFIEKQAPDLDSLIAYMRDVGKVTAGQASEDLGISRTTITSWFSRYKKVFRLEGREGRHTYYSLASDLLLDDPTG